MDIDMLHCYNYSYTLAPNGGQWDRFCKQRKTMALSYLCMSANILCAEKTDCVFMFGTSICILVKAV